MAKIKDYKEVLEISVTSDDVKVITVVNTVFTINNDNDTDCGITNRESKKPFINQLEEDIII